MTEMNRPYGYIEAEIEKCEAAAQSAKTESIRLKAIATVNEERAKSLRQALGEQRKADGAQQG